MPFVAQPTEKCAACGRTVYQTERATVDEKDSNAKKVYHKQCIRCSTCNKVLQLGEFSSMEGQFWCKPHFKQLFQTKGNYDESFGKEKYATKFEGAAAPPATPTTFIPEVKEEKQAPKQASEKTVEKFRQFREQGEADKCTFCGKTVYMAEKILVEDKTVKRLFHKTCFKCIVCALQLDLRNFGSRDGKMYCKNHLKEVTGLSTPSGGHGITPSSFIPETKEEKVQEKGQTPEHIASKFKGMGDSADKCKICGKTVYATEKVVLNELKNQQTFHKSCLKCSVCNIKVDVSNYGSVAGVIYCKVHLKQYGKPETAKGENAVFISPLAAKTEGYVPGPRESEAASSESQEPEGVARGNVEDDNREVEETEPEREAQPIEGKQEQVEEESKQEERREEREKQEQEDEEERARRKRQERIAMAETGETGVPSTSEDDERRRRRDAKQRERDEEERKEREEKEKRERERDERRRKREEENRKEEEENARKEEQRKRERDERRKQQEEEAKRELEEQERKAEERRKKNRRVEE